MRVPIPITTLATDSRGPHSAIHASHAKTLLMKQTALYLPGLCIALLLCSCASSHRIEFKESDFADSAATGSGTVSGKAFRIRSDSSTVVETGGTVVRLIPANAYTEEIVERKYTNREWLTRTDPRLAKYVREVETDDHGHFAFTQVPPGSYYVSCHVKWTEPVKGDGNLVEAEVRGDQWLSNPVVVKNGEVATVTGWAQGK
jgi:hypothetical protein